MTPEVEKGIFVGLAVAAIQSTLTVCLLKWAWTRKSFYAVWGACTLARFVVLGLTAFVVFRFTSLNLAATLLSLVMATMLIMLTEVGLFLKPKK